MGKITSLFRSILASVPFGRKKSGTDESNESSNASQDIQNLDQTLVHARPPSTSEKEVIEDEEEAGDGGITATPDDTEKKPGFLSSLSARIKQLFTRRNKAAAEDGGKEEILDEALSEDTPKKRHIPIKKLLIVGLPVLLVLSIAIIATVMTIHANTRHKEEAALEEKHKKDMEAQLKQLQDKNNALLEENKKLQAAPPPPAPAPAPPEATEKTTDLILPTAATPEPAPAPAPDAGKRKAPVSIGDCAVTSKENAGESLKRCIDAYNAVSQ